jgi:hypothetical protein
MKRLRTRLTYANVMATIAVFLVLAGGSALAATKMLPKNSVGARQLKKGAVTPSKLSRASKATLVGRTDAAGQRGALGPQGDRGEKGARGEVGPSTVYAGFHDEFIEMGGHALPPTFTVATLGELPAGSYAIQAKLIAMSYQEKVTDFMECVLAAEGDFDVDNQYLGTGVGGVFNDTLTMQLVHTFPATGEVTIKCGHEKAATLSNVAEIKITAIKVGSIATNHFIH